MRIRVVLADDHQVLTEGLRGLLSPRCEVVGVATTGRELVEMVHATTPDVAITDVSMPLLNGLDAIRQIQRGSGIRTKFILLTMHADVSLVVEAFRAGASAYVLKHSASSELAVAIDSVLRGRAYVSPALPTDVLTVLAEAARHRSSEGSKLTRRQREVLQLVAEGKAMKEVAATLGISVRTAESYKYEIMHSLGLHSNAELVQFAIRIGLITVQPITPAA
ncbi:MAG TPA: response regulator transcription factor [Terriglobales bacterium]|nr:response regulator transcription factor [Terriglobales bacterium]